MSEKPPGQWGGRRTAIKRCAFVAHVTMGDQIEEVEGGAKIGGGGKPMKTAKAVQVFVQATSEAEHMPATTTGDIMLFHHGQRSARKSTPTVNGVYPGSWTEDTVMSFDGTQHWDGVNLLKHHPNMVILPGSEEALKKCRFDVEGHYSLSGVDILVSDWPRGDGCHKPDSAVMDENGKVVAHSNELHEAFERSQEFDEYTYDCVFGVSATSTAYNFFMTAQHEFFCPAMVSVGARLSAAAEHGHYVGARDLEFLAESVYASKQFPVNSVVDKEFFNSLGEEVFKLGSIGLLC